MRCVFKYNFCFQIQLITEDSRNRTGDKNNDSKMCEQYKCIRVKRPSFTRLIAEENSKHIICFMQINGKDRKFQILEIFFSDEFLQISVIILLMKAQNIHLNMNEIAEKL